MTETLELEVLKAQIRLYMEVLRYIGYEAPANPGLVAREVLGIKAYE